MDELAEEYSQSGIRSIFIYTHETHPGENVPHLASMQQKFDHARQFKEAAKLRRPILLDSLDGACHRAYGSMPNMTLIFDRTGRVVYRAPWTAVRSVASALEYLEETRELRSQGIRVAPLQIGEWIIELWIRKYSIEAWNAMDQRRSGCFGSQVFEHL